MPGSAAPATKLYVRDAPLPEALQEAPIAPADGNVYEAMPVSPSVELRSGRSFLTSSA